MNGSMVPCWQFPEVMEELQVIKLKNNGVITWRHKGGNSD
jgi:hypothetical protein